MPLRSKFSLFLLFSYRVLLWRSLNLSNMHECGEVTLRARSMNENVTVVAPCSRLNNRLIFRTLNLSLKPDTENVLSRDVAS